MTAYGRLKLLSLMELVPEDQMCYCDTDSIQFMLHDSQTNPFTSQLTGNLGDLTDEVRCTSPFSAKSLSPHTSSFQIEADQHIAKGAWAGCKNYALQLLSNDGKMKEKVAVRGVTRTGRTECQLNFDHMEKALDWDLPDLITEHNEIRRPTIGEVATVTVAKRWRPVQSKNKPVPDGMSYVPYGYKV